MQGFSLPLLPLKTMGLNLSHPFDFLLGWFVCTPVDLLLVQWMLAMSLVTNGVSRFFSRSWSLLCCSDSIDSFLSGFEGLSKL